MKHKKRMCNWCNNCNFYQYLTEEISDSNFNGAPSSSSTSNPRSMDGAKILISGGIQLRRRLYLEF